MPATEPVLGNSNDFQLPMRVRLPAHAACCCWWYVCSCCSAGRARRYPCKGQDHGWLLVIDHDCMQAVRQHMRTAGARSMVGNACNVNMHLFCVLLTQLSLRTHLGIVLPEEAVYTRQQGRPRLPCHAAQDSSDAGHVGRANGLLHNTGGMAPPLPNHLVQCNRTHGMH